MSSLLWEGDSTPAPISMNYTNCSTSTQSNFLKEVHFGGVPVVLLLDFCVFLFLIVLFSAIRGKLWDYGRLALVSEADGFMESTHRRFGRMTSTVDDPEADAGCCSWLPFVIGMDSETMKAKCGIDAVHYMSFQRHLIFLLALVTVASLAVILPVNLSGDLLGVNPYDFGRTTIANLPQGNNLLWLHTVFAVLYLIVTVALLRHYTSQMKGMRRETARNTLFVRSVPKEATDEEVKTHFTEAYPTCQVTAVTLGYDVAKLIQLDKERMRAHKNLRYYEKDLQRTGKRGAVNLRRCNILCCCACCNCEKVDAIEYYSNQEAALLEEVSKQRELVPQRPLGMAFVTLQSEAMAKFILKDFNALDCGGGADSEAGRVGCGCACVGWEPQPSPHSAALKVKKWKVSFAPHPINIYWENLSVQGVGWWARCLILNLFLILLLTFFTTPSIILNTMDSYNVTQPLSLLNSAVVSQFFPTLLLWSFSALLPTIVYYCTLGEFHWSRSSEQQSMMHKLYIFLLFMVLILPSLGFTSLAVFLPWLFDKDFLDQGKLRFECVFLPDQGAFFVNYVIAAALLGSGMELLRLPGLLLYTIRMMLARSAAERKYVKQNQAYEFEYGAMYSWTLCVFTVIMSYSIICPIIAPFGLLYLMLKHLVDKHNLYFAFLPTRLDRQVHLAAVNQALAAPIICLICLYFFSVLRMGFKAVTSLFTFVVLCVTVFIFTGYNCFGNFKYLSPHNYSVKEEDEETDEKAEHATVYLPRVLSTEEPDGAQSPPSYGSTQCSPEHSACPVDDTLLLA
ncbi:CSC1-like protein 1 isoform X1 [Gadus chalcogrammus]|uniref:CSC1-like protein 1 isoform X1 n=2 Tax=Gadus chalcogrammus TaxID=1042646 RepID=UPI0024C4C0BE|nr:CSC1-like protein 1 isoform X1 [Gadus chalcogrammus]